MQCGILKIHITDQMSKEGKCVYVYTLVDSTGYILSVS